MLPVPAEAPPMYSVVLSSLISFGATTADCCWHRWDHTGYAGCAACIPVMEMPLSCGCCPSPCPTCGGMPPMGPPMIGEMGAPTVAPPMAGEMGAPPVGGTVLPSVPIAEAMPPVVPPPALGETRTSANQAL